ncbi:hypothetical protein GWK47_047597 [Chionoecetes opilio]|uniref:Platelet-derived growth factor (PDGF) family profile domain-containing protein n=1 Tax=Chionoecetes opilio TaxID=41210 RepID=A0A8J5CV66_CHIOP|nr:hypothetical protein GWK47_047597 [Chionoecetes opilio]
MVMKMLVMVTVVVMLNQGVVQGCRSRADKAIMHRLKKTTSCDKPHESLVQLPVPEGYDYVKPSVVKLNRCAGLSCDFRHDQCFPDEDYIALKKYTVFAFKGSERKCVQVSVEEHGVCKCKCDRECPDYQVCNARYDDGEPVMWSEDVCFCECNSVPDCDHGMLWNDRACRCV